MSDAGMPPGWYHGEGDPVGTKRYWDGNGWVGDPQTMMSDATDAPVAPGVTTAAGRTVSSAGKRMGARIIDVIILAIIGTVIAVVFGVGVSGSAAFETNGSAIATGIVSAIVGFLWDALFVSKMGATPGKLMLGMQVVDASTGMSPPADPTGWKRAANRLLGIIPILGSLIAFVVGLVSLIFLFTDDNRQTVMDRFASTMVVDK